ncbi:MAG: hypothetical protein M3R04_05900 [bacterium]|nr:hypothetical protein [bacterium]
MPNPSELARTQAKGPLATADILREAKGHARLAYDLLRKAWEAAHDISVEYDIDAIAGRFRPQLVEIDILIDQLEEGS